MAYIPPNPNGQATSANSAPVVIASDQSAVGATEVTLHAGEDLANDVQKVSSKSGILRYQATPANDVVVSAGPSYLEGIIFGANNAGAQVQISDHVSSGGANVVLQINGDTLLTAAGGYMPVNAHFSSGIVCNIVNQTQLTFVGW
jgi:hypothetical protein